MHVPRRWPSPAMAAALLLLPSHPGVPASPRPRPSVRHVCCSGRLAVGSSSPLMVAPQLGLRIWRRHHEPLRWRRPPTSGSCRSVPGSPAPIASSYLRPKCSCPKLIVASNGRTRQFGVT